MSASPIDLTPENARQIIDQLIIRRDAKVRADLQLLSAGDDGLENMLAEKLMRRDQVLYSVGHVDKEEFRYADIEAFIRRRFPATNPGTVLNVSSAMAELAEGDNGILKRNPDGTAYMLKTPLFRSTIQAMLRCADGKEVVERV